MISFSHGKNYKCHVKKCILDSAIYIKIIQSLELLLMNHLVLKVLFKICDVFLNEYFGNISRSGKNKEYVKGRSQILANHSFICEF